MNHTWGKNTHEKEWGVKSVQKCIVCDCQRTIYTFSNRPSYTRNEIYSFADRPDCIDMEVENAKTID